MRVLTLMLTAYWILNIGPAHAQTKSAKLFYVSQPVMEEGTGALLSQVQDQIGRNIAASLDGRIFESAWSITEQTKGAGDDLSVLSTYSGQDYLNVARAKAKALRNRKVDRLLRVNAFRLGNGRLSVRLDLYVVPDRRDEQPTLHRSKWVAPCGGSDQSVIDQLGEAIACLADGCNRELRAAIHVQPSLDVNVGQEITLDGCASADRDYDALRWEWRDETTGRTWSGRAVATSFTEPGTRTIVLTVRSGPGDGDVRTATVEVRVIEAPVANAGASRKVVAKKSAIAIDLDGSESRSSQDAVYEWEQISGPIGTWPDAERMSCKRKRCKFIAPSSGAYQFRLRVQDGALVSTDETMVLVNPNVKARINTFGRRHMFPTFTIKLAAVADASELDQNPIVSWRVERWNGTEWAPDESAVLGAPSETTTTLTPSEEGEYRVLLSSRGRKTAGARELWASGDAVARILVSRPIGFFYGDLSAAGPVATDISPVFKPRLNLLSTNSPVGFRFAFSVGVLDTDRGLAFDLDLHGGATFPYREVNLHQGVYFVGPWATRSGHRNRWEQGLEVGTINIYRPLGRFPVMFEFFARLALDEDDVYGLFGVALGTGTHIGR